MAFVALFFLFCPLAIPCTPEENPNARPQPETGTVVTGIVMPHQEVTLGPVLSGRIAGLLVKEGQTVQQGALLAFLEEEVQRARVAVAKIQAESTVDIELAKVRMESALEELERLTKLDQHASAKERKEAQTGADIARLEYAKAEKEHELALRQYELEQLRLEQLRIYAPFNGYVTGLLKRVGETVDEREGVLTLVQLDSLEVNLDCPLRLAGKIRKGNKWVVEPFDKQWPPEVGEAVLVSHVADPASQTFKVKLRVANERTRWVSGLKVQVDFGQVYCRDASKDPSSPERKPSESPILKGAKSQSRSD